MPMGQEGIQCWCFGSRTATPRPQSDCSAWVEEVHPLPGQDALVRFTDPTTRNDASRMTPGHEHNYY